MDIYEKINNLIKKLERYGTPKTISKKFTLQELESIAKLFLNLDCIGVEDRELGNKLYDISQKIKQPKYKVLKLLRSIKKILTRYDIKTKLENQKFKPGKIIIFNAGSNYSAYDQLKKFFTSAENNINIIDSYLNPKTFHILKNVSKEIKIKLITKHFYRNSKIDFKSFENEYTIEARESENIHDRFFIIDNIGYFSGSSLHNVGNKLSAIAMMSEEDTKILQKEFDKIWNKSKKIK